jgi:hypothetical protein
MNRKLNTLDFVSPLMLLHRYINPQLLAGSNLGETIAQSGALIQFSDLGPGCKIPTMSFLSL